MKLMEYDRTPYLNNESGNYGNKHTSNEFNYKSAAETFPFNFIEANSPLEKVSTTPTTARGSIAAPSHFFSSALDESFLSTSKNFPTPLQNIFPRDGSRRQDASSLSPSFMSLHSGIPEPKTHYPPYSSIRGQASFGLSQSMEESPLSLSRVEKIETLEGKGDMENGRGEHISTTTPRPFFVENVQVIKNWRTAKHRGHSLEGPNLQDSRSSIGEPRDKRTYLEEQELKYDQFYEKLRLSYTEQSPVKKLQESHVSKECEEAKPFPFCTADFLLPENYSQFHSNFLQAPRREEHFIKEKEASGTKGHSSRRLGYSDLEEGKEQGIPDASHLKEHALLRLSNRESLQKESDEILKEESKNEENTLGTKRTEEKEKKEKERILLSEGTEDDKQEAMMTRVPPKEGKARIRSPVKVYLGFLNQVCEIDRMLQTPLMRKAIEEGNRYSEELSLRESQRLVGRVVKMSERVNSVSSRSSHWTTGSKEADNAIQSPRKFLKKSLSPEKYSPSPTFLPVKSPEAPHNNIVSRRRERVPTSDSFCTASWEYIESKRYGFDEAFRSQGEEMMASCNIPIVVAYNDGSPQKKGVDCGESGGCSIPVYENERNEEWDWRDSLFFSMLHENPGDQSPQSPAQKKKRKKKKRVKKAQIEVQRFPFTASTHAVIEEEGIGGSQILRTCAVACSDSSENE